MIKIVASIFVVVCTLAVLAGLQDDQTFPIVQILPFCGGHPPGLYDWAGLAVILITLAGVTGLLSPSQVSDQAEEDEYEESVPDSAEESEDSDGREDAEDDE